MTNNLTPNDVRRSVAEDTGILVTGIEATFHGDEPAEVEIRVDLDPTQPVRILAISPDLARTLAAVLTTEADRAEGK